MMVFLLQFYLATPFITTWLTSLYPSLFLSLLLSLLSLLFPWLCRPRNHKDADQLFGGNAVENCVALSLATSAQLTTLQPTSPHLTTPFSACLNDRFVEWKCRSCCCHGEKETSLQGKRYCGLMKNKRPSNFPVRSHRLSNCKQQRLRSCSPFCWV